VDKSKFNCGEEIRRNKEPCFMDSWTPAYHYEDVDATAMESDWIFDGERSFSYWVFKFHAPR